VVLRPLRRALRVGLERDDQPWRESGVSRIADDDGATRRHDADQRDHGGEQASDGMTTHADFRFWGREKWQRAANAAART